MFNLHTESMRIIRIVYSDDARYCSSIKYFVWKKTLSFEIILFENDA